MTAGAHAVRAAPPPKSKALFARKGAVQGGGAVDFVLRRQLGASAFLPRTRALGELTGGLGDQQNFLRQSLPSFSPATSSTRPNTISRPTSPRRLHGTSARPSRASCSSPSGNRTQSCTTRGESESRLVSRLPLRARALIRFPPSDAFLIAWWVIAFCFLREAMMRWVFVPVAKACGVRSRRALIRFSEQGWSLAYYSASIRLVDSPNVLTSVLSQRARGRSGWCATFALPGRGQIRLTKPSVSRSTSTKRARIEA